MPYPPADRGVGGLERCHGEQRRGVRRWPVVAVGLWTFRWEGVWVGLFPKPGYRRLGGGPTMLLPHLRALPLPVPIRGVEVVGRATMAMAQIMVPGRVMAEDRVIEGLVMVVDRGMVQPMVVVLTMVEGRVTTGVAVVGQDSEPNQVMAGEGDIMVRLLGEGSRMAGVQITVPTTAVLVLVMMNGCRRVVAMIEATAVMMPREVLPAVRLPGKKRGVTTDLHPTIRKGKVSTVRVIMETVGHPVRNAMDRVLLPEGAATVGGSREGIVSVLSLPKVLPIAVVILPGAFPENRETD
ncbi:hypothetical protein CCP3SC15_1030002 [Gammaproteobacteria bacterium]